MNPSVLSRTAIAAAVFVASGTLAFADTATTDPVGFFTKGLTASGGTSRVNRTVSFPLYKPAVYTAAATSVTNGAPNSTCQLNGANFTTTDVVTQPHLVRVKASATAAHVGRFFLIAAASADQLTVAGSSLTSFISVGDTCEVLPANTLASVFGTGGTLVAGWVTGSTASASDNLFIWNGTAWDTHFHDGAKWRKSPGLSTANFDKTIIYPDEGVFVSRIGTTPIDLITTGTVPTTTERTDITGTTSTFMSNRFPVDMQLGNVGFELLPGWVANSNATSADKVLVWNGTAWDTYFYGGSFWRKSPGLPTANFNTTVITAGSAVFVQRVGAGALTLSQSLPYTP